ncbi:MAG: hypothetical protein HKN47_06145 [Pirellulaceae bacterium]|nr:hypothetical protein [Pirellulaceae bacterium]
MQDPITGTLADRLERLTQAVGETERSLHGELLLDPTLIQRPWIAIASSRLGHQAVLHQEVCQYVSRCMKECRERDAVLLIAAGSAIDPWATRAAALFQVPAIRISVGQDNNEKDLAELQIRSSIDQPLNRDEVLIALADFVDAVYVRRNGTIANCLGKRIHDRADASTRVAITSLPNCAGKTLIQKGAVGWWTTSHKPERDQGTLPQSAITDESTAWMHTDDQWLIHCTRGCTGPWPGQTENQYRDELLLGGQIASRRPLDTLIRILRSGRLVAGAIASARQWPVVCFSAAPLTQLLISRRYRPHLKRWDYEPFGIAISRSAAQSIGIQQVIYGKAADRAQISESDQFRFHPAGKTYDWTAEREWRSPVDVDLSKLGDRHVRVFVANAADAIEIQSHCPWRISVLSEALRSGPDAV